MGLIWNHTIWNLNLEPSDKITLLWLADRTLDEKKETEFTLEHAEEYIGLSRRQIVRILQKYHNKILKYIAGKGRGAKNRIIWGIQQRKTIKLPETPVFVEEKPDIKPDIKGDIKPDIPIYKETTLTTSTTPEEGAGVQTEIPVSQLDSQNETQLSTKIQSALETLDFLNIAHALNRDKWELALHEAERKKFDFSTLEGYIEFLQTDDLFSWRDSGVTPQFFLDNLHRYQPKPKQKTPRQIIEFQINDLKETSQRRGLREDEKQHLAKLENALANA